MKLPGLQYRNQRVEAAYRKELIYGEDDPERARPATVAELFSRGAGELFPALFQLRLLQHRPDFYLQADNVFGLVILAPTIVAGAITLGLLTQIQFAFDQVRSLFQYLVSSWTTIVELASIYKRLRSFEAVIDGGPLPAIDHEAQRA